MGKIYTYDKALPEGAEYPFRTVGKGDAWIDDPKHPDYNKHVVVDPANPPVELMLHWNDGSWEHGAYWGENRIPHGTDGTASRRSADTPVARAMTGNHHGTTAMAIQPHCRAANRGSQCRRAGADVQTCTP